MTDDMEKVRAESRNKMTFLGTKAGELLSENWDIGDKIIDLHFRVEELRRATEKEAWMRGWRDARMYMLKIIRDAIARGEDVEEVISRLEGQDLMED